MTFLTAVSRALGPVGSSFTSRVVGSIALGIVDRHIPKDSVRESYKFLQSRYLQVVACQPGPQRTAEGYVMIHYLTKRS
jgi:hypothetical protein